MAGLALVGILVGYFGADGVFRSLLAVGWAGFATICLIHLALMAAMGIAWWALLPGTKLWISIWGRLVREAVTLQGFEEARHAELLRLMIHRYGVAAEERPPDPPSGNLVRAFADFGYGECLDAFLGFGVFKIARRAGFLPEAMFEIFETLIHEETRHIVFFINWMAWQQIARGRAASWLRGATAAHYYARAIGRLLQTVWRGRSANDGKDFSATQASVFLEGFTFQGFVEECRAEHARRMEGFDPDLLQPHLLPRLADLALAGLRLSTRVGAVREKGV